MEALFLKLLNMSLTASWLVLAVVVLRLILKKAPKFIRCILWGLVALRLVFPFSIESVLSLIPSAEPLPQDIVYTATPTVNTGIPAIDHAIDPILSQSLAPAPLTSINPTQVISLIASVVWICGVTAMFIYMAASYLRVKFMVREAVALRDNVYLCDRISSPFILGVIAPKIYLPSTMERSDIEHVVSHENSHLKRRDHWWKPLGFLILCIYWFNPVIWLAYILLCRDIELACDEKVIKQMNAEDKKAYTHALLNCSIPRRMISACPLAFGEVGVKNRVRNVLSYKKPAFWIILIAVIACIVTAVCFLTDPKDDDIKSPENISKEDYISVSNVRFGTDAPENKVEIEFKSAVVHTDKDNIVIEWKNHTDSALILENDWSFYNEIDGKWETIRDTQSFETVGSTRHGAKESIEETYSFANQYFSSGNRFLFEQNFSLSDDPGTEYTAFVEFEIDHQPLQLGIYYEHTDDTGRSRSSKMGHQVLFGDYEFDIRESDDVKYKIKDLRNGKLLLEFTKPLVYNGEEITEFEISYGEKKLLTSSLGERYTLMFPNESSIFSQTTVGDEDSPVTLYESDITWAGYSKNIDELFTKRTNSAYFLPLCKIESFGQLEEFKDNCKNKLDLTLGTNDLPSFESSSTGYDEEFFEDNLLFIVYVRSSKKHTSFYKLSSVYNDTGSFRICVTEEAYSSKKGENAGYFVTVATSKKDVENCEVFDAVLDTVSYGVKISSDTEIDHTHEFGRFDGLYKGFFHTAPTLYIDHLGESIKVGIGKDTYDVRDSEAVCVRDFLKNAPFDTEKVCDCPAELTVTDPRYPDSPVYELNLSLAFARCEKGQIALTEKQVCLIMEYLDELHPYVPLEQPEDLEHIHTLSAYPSVKEKTYYIDPGWCGTGAIEYRTILIKDGVNYAIYSMGYVNLYNILANAYYDPNELCDCPAEFTAFGTQYEVNLSCGFARCEKGQVKLTPWQIGIMQSLVENMKTEEEYQAFLTSPLDLFDQYGIPLLGSKYITYDNSN